MWSYRIYWWHFRICLLGVLLSLAAAPDAKAIMIEVPVNFFSKAFDEDRRVVAGLLAEDIAGSKIAYPSDNVEILVSSVGPRLWAIVRGSPSFCDDRGCTLIVLRRGSGGEPPKLMLRTRTSGYVLKIGWDFPCRDCPPIVIETLKSCKGYDLKLRYVGEISEPCRNHRAERLSPLLDTVRRRLRQRRIGYMNLRDNLDPVDLLSDVDLERSGFAISFRVRWRSLREGLQRDIEAMVADLGLEVRFSDDKVDLVLSPAVLRTWPRYFNLDDAVLSYPEAE